MKPGSDKASPAELLQCITIYHVHLLVSTELRGLTFPHLCLQKIFFFPLWCVCVRACVCCRSLTILWMNRSPRMFFNTWASSVICIFITNLCYSTVIILNDTLVDRLPTSSQCNYCSSDVVEVFFLKLCNLSFIQILWISYCLYLLLSLWFYTRKPFFLCSFTRCSHISCSEYYRVIDVLFANHTAEQIIHSNQK